MITEEELAACDPGIRGVVRLLNEYDFHTTDSGDGCSKLAEMGCAEATPNVYMTVGVTVMRDRAQQLYKLIAARIGVPQMFDDGPSWQVQATYDPADDTAILSLHGVDDSLFGEG